MKEHTCCFTGHRIIPADHIDAITARTEIKIRELVLKQGFRYFGVGGAMHFRELTNRLCCFIMILVNVSLIPTLRESIFPQPVLISSGDASRFLT